MGPYFPPDTAAPTAADPYVLKSLAPPTTNPPSIPETEPPAVTEPDEAEIAAAAPGPQSSISLDQVGCLSLTPVMHERCRSRKETVSPQANIYCIS